MTSDAATLPLARGRLSTTSLVELLVLALERRLNGSFVFETPESDRSALVVASGRVIKVRTAAPVELLGHLLTDSGLIDRATLERGLRVAQERKDRLGDALIQLDAIDGAGLERALREQLGRRLTWLAELPEASVFGFYTNVDLLEDRPGCGAEPLSLIWRCIRDGRATHPRRDQVLAALGTRPLRLRARAALDPFELSTGERACIEGLSLRPLALDALLAQPGLDAAVARRLIYALLITHQLEPHPSSLVPPRIERPSVPPRAPAAAATIAALRPTSSPVALRSSPPAAASPSRPEQATGSPQASSIPPVNLSASSAPRPRSAKPEAGASRSQAPDRVEHALERASRLVRERTRAEGAAEAARSIEAAQEPIARKQFAEAERLVRAACKADPNNSEHLALHAWLRMQNGDLAVPAVAAEVVASLDRAVMKAPMSVSVRFHRAQVLKRLGRDEEAYKDFRFVARRAPDQLDAVREVRLHLLRTRNKQQQSGVFSKIFLR